MKNYKWLFFDADETLFDFKKAEYHAFKHLIGNFSSEDQIRLFTSYQNINEMLWKCVEKGTMTQDVLKIERFSRWIDSNDLAMNAKETSEQFVEALSQGSYLIDGAEQVCQVLSKDYQMAILTNGIEKVQTGRFMQSSIRSFFKHLIISEEIGISKPDKRFFEYAMQKTGCTRVGEILMIGDSLTSDIQGGIRAGIATCWYNPAKLVNSTDWHPTFEVHQLEDLLVLLSR